ncbi:hypothetical protein [Synechococcus sp. RS9916]|uniref:hypothetical protein n=1 Tax=Synechococcus sp. RS9916 TaxID=221359 RepID=UPI0018DBFD02|nr:hypothetical protein [Synechococcus sp. RS9916]
MKEKMNLSIIVPSLGSELASEKLLILAQTVERYKEIELIVVVPENYKGCMESEDYSMILVKSKGKIYAAMNEGIRHASGKWLYFCGDTDTPYIQNLRSVIGEIGDILNSWEIVVATGIVQVGKKLREAKIDNYKQLLIAIERNPTHHQAIIYKKNFVISLGMYDENYTALADYKLNLEARRVIKEQKDLYCHQTNKIFGKWDIETPGISMRRRRKNYQESYNAKCGHLNNWAFRLLAIGVEVLTYLIGSAKTFIENNNFRD